MMALASSVLLLTLSLTFCSFGQSTTTDVPQEPTVDNVLCDFPMEIKNGQTHIVREVPHSTSGFSAPGLLSGSLVSYICDEGYKIDDPSRAILRCTEGHWSDQAPQCIRERNTGCPYPRVVPHASVVVRSEMEIIPLGQPIPDNSWLDYTCHKGYTTNLNGVYSSFPVCIHNEWTGEYPTCVLEEPQYCDSPPLVAYGNYSVIPQMLLPDSGTAMERRFPDGVRVSYYCNNGFKIKTVNTSVLQCVAGSWHGTTPTCERRTHCDVPMDIENGNWVVDPVEYFSPTYGVGTRIRYECHNGYKPFGVMELVCLSTHYWSQPVPRCLVQNDYCPDPGPLENGIIKCDPSNCNLFQVGISIHYICEAGYEPVPNNNLVQECMPKGIWSGSKPVCKAVSEATTPKGHFYTNTLTVVIATSCGVLGLLVVVMVIVALQRRRKKHSRNSRGLCHTTPPAPPPYQQTPPTGLVDDPDRAALIAFADGVQVVLPSYDEAVRGRGSSRLSRYTSDSTRGSIRSSSSRDYRPLPSLPSGLRAGGPQIREIPPDGHRDHHRNSIITTASIMTRDNLSLALGSIDTMNISDGTSTSVTVDTASSNPSIATSQRAAAGSLESSSTNGSIATEDAPLLDQNHYNTETLRSFHSNTSDPHRCQCTERISGYDTLHSQCSRSQSESSPIVEVPEGNKDTS